MTSTITPAAHCIKSTALTAGELNFYQREGYLQIPGLLGTQHADTLRQEVMDIMHQIGGVEGSKLKQTLEYLENSSLDRFINSNHLRNIAEQLMGGPSTLYLPFTAVKGSGGGLFHFHQDNNYTQFDGPGINLWFALVDMTPENGCLMIVPRSHSKGNLESENAGDGDTHRKVKLNPDDFLPIRMRAGDCVAFSRLTVHGSGANTTPQPRVGYAVQFHRNDVRFLDRESGNHKLLIEHSPQKQYTRPVKQITVPKGKIDGH
jgi:2-oxoglutarate-dependent dioxygenase